MFGTILLLVVIFAILLAFRMGYAGKLIARIIMRFIPPKRPADFNIGGSMEDPYMRRWWIIPRNRFFNIYLHQMRHDDDDRAPHDHPFHSLSLCLDGYVKEYELILDYPDNQMYRINAITAGQFKWRGLKYTHRLELPEGEAWTIFITGPRLRRWGFHCRKGFVYWKDFVDSDEPGKPGRGCGEKA